MNTLNQQRHNHTETSPTVKVSPRTQKVEIHVAMEGSGLELFITDLGNIFRCNVGKEFGVLLRRKGPHQPEFAYDIVFLLVIYTDQIGHNIHKIVGDTKAPLLHCFSFISQLKAGNVIITGQYMKYQTFSKLQFIPMLKNSF